jgi:hypothetical protein
MGPAGQRLVADRAARRGGIGLVLGAGLHGPVLQFPGWAQHRGFQVAKVWIGGGDELSRGRFQVHGQFGATVGSEGEPCGRPHEQTGADRQVVFKPSFYQLPPAFTHSKK